jgi:cytochrome c-type biogenesis protein CcmH
VRPATARLLAGLAAAACLGAASDPAEVLPDPAQEARARALFAEIRCVVCQNESIDGSDAELAQDLRMLVRAQVAEGRSDAEIKTFLVDRYGEFVLFRPSFSAGNLLLWLGPFAVVVLAGSVLVATARRRRGSETASGVALSAEERARLEALTKDQS